jgi:twitching motility protein PilT
MSEPSPQIPDLAALLSEAVQRRASDLHLHCGSPPLARVHGEIVALPGAPLTPETCYYLIYSQLSELQRTRCEEQKGLDFAIDVPNLGRFRANAHYTRGALEAVFRHIPEQIPDLEALGHRPAVTELCKREEGLILITGITGAGTTTTLASMIQHISRKTSGLILTIEDPIEFGFAPAMSIIKQREVGPDVKSFSDGVQQALRQDPDVIIVGEMRDRETMQATLTAAETGHLVIGTLHTVDASKTVDRIVDIFPSEQQNQVLTQLSNCLVAVISQRLLPRADGQGRVLATETMIANAGIRACIRDRKPHMILGMIEIGMHEGMNSLDESLANLVRTGQVTLDEALIHARDPERLQSIAPSLVPAKKKGFFG